MIAAPEAGAAQHSSGGVLRTGCSARHALDQHRFVLLEQVLLAVEVDEVSRPRGLGPQVEGVELVGRHHVGDAARDADAVLLELRNLVGIVGHQPHRADLEAGEHVRRDRVIALVVAEAEREIGVHGVEALVLQRVGADLVDQADPAALLAEIEEQAARHRGQPAQGRLELVAAIAAQGARHVAGQALGVEPGGDVVVANDVAVDQRDVLLAVPVVPERDDPEAPEAGRKIRHRLDAHADFRRAEARAVMVLVALDQLVQGGCHGEIDAWRWRLVPAPFQRPAPEEGRYSSTASTSAAMPALCVSTSLGSWPRAATRGSRAEVVWKVSSTRSGSSWITPGLPVSPKLEGTSDMGKSAWSSSMTCQMEVRMRPLPMLRLPATKRMPFHSNMAGDS